MDDSGQISRRRGREGGGKVYCWVLNGLAVAIKRVWVVRNGVDVVSGAGVDTCQRIFSLVCTVGTHPWLFDHEGVTNDHNSTARPDECLLVLRLIHGLRPISSLAQASESSVVVMKWSVAG